MTLKPLTLAIIAATFAFPAAAQAQRGGANRGWETIGYQTVNGRGDSDTIRVRGNERYKKIRICAIGQQFRLIGARAYFANGGQQDIAGRQQLRAGECTTPLDLKGRARNLDHVGLTYTKARPGILPPLVRVQAR